MRADRYGRAIFAVTEEDVVPRQLLVEEGQVVAEHAVDQRGDALRLHRRDLRQHHARQNKVERPERDHEPEELAREQLHRFDRRADDTSRLAIAKVRGDTL